MNYERISREQIIQNRGYRKNIKGDKFSLYISNYPTNAEYLKSRIGNSEYVLAELCCSIGVTLEYLSPGFKKVIGVDLDRNVLDICQMNLKESGIPTPTELIHGDVIDDKILKKIKADIVIYDIPFWYPHKQEQLGNLIEQNPPLLALVEKIKAYITPNIIIFAPPEWTLEYFKQELGEIEYEQVIIKGKHNRNQIYLGDLIHHLGKTSIELNGI